MSAPGILPRRRSMTDAFHLVRNPEAAAAARNDLMNVLNHARQREARLDAFANSLPRLSEADLAALGQSDSTCPICLTSLLALLAEEEIALAMDSPAHPVEELGVTRLVQTCGHIFCRKDIRGWLYQGHTTCPTCRRPFITPAPDEPRARGDADDIPPEAALLDELLDHALAEASVEMFPSGRFFDFSGEFRDAARRTDARHNSDHPSGGDDGDGREPDAHFDYDDDRSAFSGMYS